MAACKPPGREVNMRDLENSTRKSQLFFSPFIPKRYSSVVADILLTLGVLGLLALFARAGAEALVGFRPPDLVPQVSLDPVNLPNYALRTVVRMFIALGLSTLFSIGYGCLAAHSRRWEQILIPLLDILQSVPILGFLSITVTGFIALFPGSLLGLEAASIFAIFTSQAWNMTFSFYQSLQTVPKDLLELAKIYRLSSRLRFLSIELPWSAIELIWNGMMSFSGGWFFVSASEAISVLNQNYTLPGIGSYVTLAIQAQDTTALLWAIVTMAIVIVLVNEFFWRPITAWAHRFRYERSASQEAPTAWLLNLLKAAQLPRLLSARFARPIDASLARSEERAFMRQGTAEAKKGGKAKQERLFSIGLAIACLLLFGTGIYFILEQLEVAEIVRVLLLGSVTFLRVAVLLVLATLVWTPIGVVIGLNPRIARLAQPLVQFVSSFPANFLFPFATLFFIRIGLPIDVGGILLMALGAQWYILFNVIAGASRIPTELREMSINIGLRKWTYWRELILPAIFPAWVTGAITAAGGAWNASIVAEAVNWGDQRFVATGLGAYITEVTSTGDWPRIALGVGVMSLFVVGLNGLFWRRLYNLATTKYRLA